MQGPFVNQRTVWQRVRQVLAPLLVALVAFGKWIGAGLKFLLPALKFVLPLLKTGGTMLISVAVYAMLWGWQFAAGFVLLLFVHEAGHLLAARWMGLNVGWPVFIPFMGAFIALKEAPRNAWIESVVGAGGPLIGGLAAVLVGAVYFITGHPLFLALGYMGLFLNLFNLIPIVPLDGGRIVSAISPWLWVVGLVIIVPYLVLRASGTGFVILLIVLMSVPRVIALFRRRSPEDARYFECTPAQRWTMGLLYLGMLGGMALTMGLFHDILTGHFGG
jgi:Zn-dependent protease